MYVNGYDQPPLPMIPNRKLQEAWVYKITALPDNSVFIGHMNYLNFSSFMKNSPIYINLVKDPIDRLVSAHYYNRRPDVIQRIVKYQPWSAKKNSQWLELDFNDCVRKQLPECRFEQDSTFVDPYWSRQMLYFCGTEKICATFNTKEVLQRAKYNVEQHYALVGSWEDTNMTLTLLEHHIPSFFRNATSVYYENFKKIRNRNRGDHPEVAQDVRRMLKKNFTNEYEFYYFCKQQIYQKFLALTKLY